MSILLLPETFVAATSCASGVFLGATGLVSLQGFRKKREAKKQLALDPRHLPKEDQSGTSSAVESKKESKPKTQAEEAKEYNQEQLELAKTAYSDAKAWLISIIDEKTEEDRASILRKFYRFGYFTHLRQVQEYLSFGVYGSDHSYWHHQSVNLHFFSALVWNEEFGNWEQDYYSGCLRLSVKNEEVGKALPNTESDWETFARLVETAEEDGVAMEKVDRFIRLSAANLFLNLNTVAGAPLSMTSEEMAEAGRRQEEIGDICFELLTQDLRQWEARARAPKEDPIEAAKSRVADMIAKEAEDAKRKEEEAKQAAKHEAELERMVVNEKTGEVTLPSENPLPDEPLVARFKEVYASMTEAEQRAGDKYVERLVEAVEAEAEAVDFSEASKNRVMNLTAENRRIALEQLESLLAASGTSREAELVRSLRVSNRLLVEQQGEAL